MSKNTEVYFTGNFWGHDNGDISALSLKFTKEFEINGKLWYIPYLYISDSGLTVDFCIRINPEEFKSKFIEKWDLINNIEDDFSDEDILKIEADNPLNICYLPEISINAENLRFDHSSSIIYNPLFPASIDEKAAFLAKSYQLDLSYCWVFLRASFECKNIKNIDIKKVNLKLISRPVALPAEHFRFSKKGDTKEVTNPVTGKKHILTYIKSEEKSISHHNTQANDKDLSCTVITYTVSPDISAEFFGISDCEKARQNFAFCVLGTEENTHIATSVPKEFAKKTEDIEWYCIFYEKLCDDFEISFEL